MERNLAIASAALAGLLPITAVHGAYLLNILAVPGLAQEFICMPYIDGCVSISRAARSGPGLVLFRAMMLPAAALLALNWYLLRRWLLGLHACSRRRARVIALLGMVAAVFLVLYVTALGNDGEWYRWQRRYGVILYFGGTALAQLLLVWVLWPLRHTLLSGRLTRCVAWLMALVSLQWMLGVFSLVKRYIFADPGFIDKLENIIEWCYALPMVAAFIVIAWMYSRTTVLEMRRVSLADRSDATR